MPDISLYYVKKGSGPPLVLLHGNGEDSGYFSRQIDFFAHTHTVYALDTRGHGWSPRGTAPFTLYQFARDLLDFLDQQNISQTDILGFSDGGNIALLFALSHPERVWRLVLNGANLDPTGVKPAVQLPIILSYQIASLFAAKNLKAQHNAELLGLMVREPHIAPASLKRLAVPALVIAGNRDMIKESHTRLIAESLPGGTLRVIPGSHFIAAENPDAFNAAVQDFFAAHPIQGR
ncbi:MAG: alpha/beta hydrolase [Oscillospiraceae bacterium]|nr:alpha/beta hydrolase [Oscillospiraceae bacterium]